jgi:tRNA threonylcarbamoyladenosine biosynthesis protein TsaB
LNLTLAIDCSMRWISLGLADSDKLYGEENANAGRAQAELLPDMAEGFVARHGFALRSLERIAVTTGPGYYTGIRVGLAYATALAAGLGALAVPMSGLYAMACPFLAPGFLAAPVLKARKDSLYAAVYGLPHGKQIGPGVFGAEEFISLINSLGCGRDEIIIIGPDPGEFDEIKNSGYRSIQTPPAIGLQMAKASIGLDAVDPAEVMATYIRPPG